ncbi:MAG TPA: two-component regulator propeller domain-containing protein [Chitinophagaceae bacterium]|nr:two-component regulator propeller domain-containing protein [Chitinophagaceae bacterium]
MRYIYCYIAASFLLLRTAAQSPNLKFERISKGLSNTAVNFIMQDKQGFMWFGTNDGLNRYDGYSFKQFKNIPGDSNSIANNNITSIYQTIDNKIWVGTYDNMSFFDPLAGRFTTIRKGAEFNATGFSGYDNGLLWVGGNAGLYSYDTKNEQWKEIVLGDKPGKNCIVTRGDDDLLWICTWDGFFKYDIKTKRSKKFDLPVSKLTPRPTNIIGSCTKDKKGFLWFTSWENGLHRFDPVTEKFESFYDDHSNPRSLSSNITKRVIENADGTIWIANAFGGLTVYDPSLQKTFNYPQNPANPFSFYGNSAESIYKDKDGTIWIGTDKGINKYSPAFNFFKTTKLISTEHPNGNFGYNSLVQDKEGELWAGGFFGFYHIDLLSGKVTEFSRSIAGREDPPINDLLIDENKTIWAASSSCLYKIDKLSKGSTPSLKSSRIELAPYQGSIMSIVKGDATHLWLTSNTAGIFRFDKITHELKQFLPDTLAGKKNNDVLCFARLDNDHWLAGVRNKGLLLFDAMTGHFKPVPITLEKTGNSTPLILDIYQDIKKNIWIATLSDGLIKTGLSLKEFKQYTEQDGLPSMRTYHIDEDKKGNIWLNTFGGLSVFDPVKKMFSNYGNNEGLRNQNMLNDLYKNEQGIFFMGDENSLQVFDPAERPENNAALPVYITSLKVQDKEYPLNSPIVLEYNRNYISFEFVALDYNQPEKIKYAYQLEGAGNEWQSTGSLRSVSFSNLKEGHYTFKVRAAGADGTWYESKDRVHFRIRAPFWKSWWFYLVAALVLTAAIYYLYRLKLNRIRNEEKIRDKIARDLHDDIGSTLSGINLYSKMVLNKTTHTDEETKTILTKIEERTGNMMDAMSDIVWSINPHNDTVADLLVRMREYAAEMLEAKDISYSFEAGEMTASLKLDLNTRKEIFLVFKEAVNNAAKHAGCTNMIIEVSTQQNKFNLRVKDNGKGIPVQSNGGNGLRNMKARAKQVNAILTIVSDQKEGTVIHLQVPLT